jgi:hypothetical protein
MTLEVSAGLELRSAGAGIAPARAQVPAASGAGTLAARLSTSVSGGVLSLVSGPFTINGQGELLLSAAAGVAGSVQTARVKAERSAPFLSVTQDIFVEAVSSGEVTPEPLPVPVMAIDFNYTVVEGHTGPRFRAQNAASAQQDCYGATDADAFGATKIVGGYDQTTGALLNFSTMLDYVKVGGLVTGFVATNASGARTLTIPAAARLAFTGVAGATASLTMGMHTAAPAATLNLLMISTGTSATTARFAISLRTDFSIRMDGRRLDAVAGTSLDIGDFRGGTELLGGTWDFANAKARATRYGDVGYGTNAYLDAGTASATEPLAATISIPIGGTFYSAILWNAPMTAPQEAALHAWQRLHYRARQTVMVDGDRSWWVRPPPARNGIIVHGFSNASGAPVVAEIDEVTRAILDQKVLDGWLWTQDDHITVAPFFLANGWLMVMVTGHSNSRSGTDDGKILVFVSTTGRINDLVLDEVLPGNMVAANYGETFAIGAADAVLFTNDDADASWLPFRLQAGVWSQGTRMVKLAVAPGGGQRQLYGLVAEEAPGVFRKFYIPHASNAQNAIAIARFVEATGVVTSGAGGATSFGSAWPGPGAPGGARADYSDLSVIYTPPPGRSCRLYGARAGGDRLLICEFDTGTGANATVHELVHGGGDVFSTASWAKGAAIVSAGAPFYAGNSWYFNGASYANYPHSGVEILLSREASGTNYLDKMNSADNGATWVTTNITTQPAAKILRPFSPVGATVANVIYGLASAYVSYANWRTRSIVAAVPS